MDFTYLNSISDGDKTFIIQFIDTFEHNTQAILDQLKQAVTKKQQDDIRRLAHQIKPSLEMLKLEAFHDAVNMQENPSNASVKLIEKMEAECHETVKALKETY